MDFFESQELARQKTKWLVFMFAMSVLAIIVAIYFLAVFAVSFASQSSGSNQLSSLATDWRLIAGVVASVLTLIGLGSFMKMIELRQGGAAVASLMGGRRIVGNAKTLTDRKVANVVEEMALASGTPVPPVYILDDEEGINAFAAGYTVDDAVIGINRGTAEKLTREELQGVIAHEFSHILNGDMRMSLRMVALLNGILLISIIGGQMLRFLSHTSRRSHRRDNDGKGNGGFIAVMFAIAIGLYLIGSIGLFFGRWIKSMVSKQREYLADASAVQFTRMPDGIAGALKMIGGTAEASSMNAPAAEQISHMFFGSFQSNFFFATHPPLLKRIQVIDGSFDGNFQKYLVERQSRYEKVRGERKQRERTENDDQDKKKRLRDFIPGGDKFDSLAQMQLPINPMVLVAGIGIPTDEDVEFSGFMVEEIQPEMLHAVRETWSARCVVFASLLSGDAAVRQQQLEMLQQNEAKGSAETTLKMLALYEGLLPHLRLGAFEIIQGTLSAMSPEQYPVFRKTVNQLITADQKVDLFEFFLYHHLIVHLDRCFKNAAPIQHRYKRLDALAGEAAEVISILAQVGQQTDAQRRTVFAAAMSSLFPDQDSSSQYLANWNHVRLSQSLTKLSQAVPAIKKLVLSAAIVAISHDGVLTVEEVELFRAMAESMDCPVPPLVATRSEAPELPEPAEIIEDTRD